MYCIMGYVQDLTALEAKIYLNTSIIDANGKDLNDQLLLHGASSKTLLHIIKQSVFIQLFQLVDG